MGIQIDEQMLVGIAAEGKEDFNKLQYKYKELLKRAVRKDFNELFRKHSFGIGTGTPYLNAALEAFGINPSDAVIETITEELNKLKTNRGVLGKNKDDFEQLELNFNGDYNGENYSEKSDQRYA